MMKAAPSCRGGRFAVAGFIVTLLAGCQVTQTEDFFGSSAPAEISGPAATAVAGDMVSRLAEQIGPGRATVRLKSDASTSAQAMEAALKAWGYSVLTDAKGDEKKAVIALTYAVTTFEGQILARLSTETTDLGRAYKVTETGATPSSAVSVLKRS